MTTLQLPQAVDFSRQWAGRVLAWWVGELRGLVPERLRALPSSSKNEDAVLEFGRNQLHLHSAAPGRLGAVIIPIGANDDLSASGVKELFPQAQVQVLLDPSFVFDTTLELPAAAEADMARILYHQLDRLVPLDPSGLSFEWSVVERIPARSAIRVAITVVRTSTLAAVRQRCSSLGLYPSKILVFREDESEVIVWSAPTTRPINIRLNRVCRMLDGATVATLILAYGVHLNNTEHLCVTLQKRLETLRTETHLLQQAERDTKATEDELIAIQQRLRLASPLLILDQLTRAVPLHTSLTEIHIKGDTVLIVGMATHATALLPIIDESGVFKDPAFVGPITAAPTAGYERFEIRFRSGISHR